MVIFVSFVSLEEATNVGVRVCMVDRVYDIIPFPEEIFDDKKIENDEKTRLVAQENWCSLEEGQLLVALGFIPRKNTSNTTTLHQIQLGKTIT